jgi:hypothetical protein
MLYKVVEMGRKIKMNRSDVNGIISIIQSRVLYSNI